MLRALHKALEQESPAPVFGMNCGTLGFLLNPFIDTDLPQRIAKARRLKLRPLRMVATDTQGTEHKFSAFNEVTLFRRHRNPISVRILVNGKEQLDALILRWGIGCDSCRIFCLQLFCPRTDCAAR